MVIVLMVKCRGSNSVQQGRGGYSPVKTKSFDVCSEVDPRNGYLLVFKMHCCLSDPDLLFYLEVVFKGYCR